MGGGLCEFQSRVPAALSNPLHNRTFPLTHSRTAPGVKQPLLRALTCHPRGCWGPSGGGELGGWGRWPLNSSLGEGMEGVTKVRPLLAKTTEVVPAVEQLEGAVCFPSAA